MMEIRKLKQFVVLAEELNFGRAAKRLHVSQPALTVAMRQLEEAVGATLLDRSLRVIQLTPAGKALVPRAHSLIEQLESAKQAARGAADGTAGVLRMSFVPTAAFRFLPDLILEFRKAYPAVQLELSEGISEEVLSDVATGRADIGFVRSMVGMASGDAFRSCVVDERPLVVALPHGHRLTARRSLRLVDLADETFIAMSPRHLASLRAQILEACAIAGFQPNMRYQAIAVSSMIGMVASGLGVALLPADATEFGHTRVVYRELPKTDQANLRSRLVAIWKLPVDSPLTRNFLLQVGASI